MRPCLSCAGSTAFNGYIHVKTIPGASPELVEQMGFLADRMSINLELPTAEGLQRLAPAKTRDRILRPMRQIQQGIALSARLQGYDRELKRIWGEDRRGLAGGASLKKQDSAGGLVLPSSCYEKERFVPGGQSTQMIVGATPESDYQMLAVTQALYENYGLKRVFYSAYMPVNQDSSLPSLPGGPPLLREHRLYQADWLLR